MPFYTTKADGTGLGLAVVQKIVVQHGGSIEARNQSSGGAEFVVWLPFVRENARTIDSAAARI
jgi:two-component system sensor histidine kinase HydH